MLRFHTAGQTHEYFPVALEEISLDRRNNALAITGTGDSFIDQSESVNRRTIA